MINQQKTFLFSLFIMGITLMACQETPRAEKEVVKAITSMEKTEKKEKVLRHVVIFKFKEESSAEEVNKLNEAFNALPAAIPVIKDFEWGLNDSPEDLHQDFTHCYLLTFASKEDRDAVYTPHPQHQAFVASLQPHLEKVFVVDYWTNP